MGLLLQGHLDLPERVTLDVVLKDPHPYQVRQLLQIIERYNLQLEEEE
jgi:hypothetical protein